MHPVDVLRAYGGHARTADLLARTTRRRLDSALATGEVIRARRGVYVLPALPSPHAAAANAGGVLSHESAADAWGFSLLTSPTAIHVTVPHGARPSAQPGVVLHWSTSPLPRAARVTPVLRTVLDCATTMPFRRALGVADSALAEGRITTSQLLHAAATSPARGRSRRLQVARAADGRAANAFESCLRAIVIEADSYAHHGSRDALVRDCERYDELVREGWRVLRFSWEHVVFQPEWVANTVARTCRRSSRDR